MNRDEIEQIRATLAERETRLQTEPLHTLQAQIYVRNVRALLDALDAATARERAAEERGRVAGLREAAVIARLRCQENELWQSDIRADGVSSPAARAALSRAEEREREAAQILEAIESRTTTPTSGGEERGRASRRDPRPTIQHEVKLEDGSAWLVKVSWWGTGWSLWWCRADDLDGEFHGDCAEYPTAALAWAEVWEEAEVYRGSRIVEWNGSAALADRLREESRTTTPTSGEER